MEYFFFIYNLSLFWHIYLKKSFFFGGAVFSHIRNNCWVWDTIYMNMAFSFWVSIVNSAYWLVCSLNCLTMSQNTTIFKKNISK